MRKGTHEWNTTFHVFVFVLVMLFYVAAAAAALVMNVH